MVTLTYYDQLSTLREFYGNGETSFSQVQYTLRNRVSSSRLFEELRFNRSIFNGDTTYFPRDWAPSSAVDYSYDIHGNVDAILNWYGGAPMENHGYNRLKTIHYKYDLVSGKVNEVHFQPGQADEFYHRYVYDADNRLTDVYTTDIAAVLGHADLEDHEAFYQYYKHGPLARAVIGQQQVQGLDYAYTLQGWLKGVNSTGADPLQDMGRDSKAGFSNNQVAKDAFGFHLNYFTGDYAPINAAVTPFPGHSAFLPSGEYRGLYNGNISSMAVTIPKLGATQLYNYRYDQLNRLVAMDNYRGFDATANNWNNLAFTEDYKERVRYDGNGNILGYLRQGTTQSGRPLAMDSLTYYYNRNSGQLVNNRLRHVKDAISATNYTEDIDSQGDDNYAYDAIGNLIKDTKDSITAIDWTVYGKIQKITKANGTVIRYVYDPSGNRIGKQVGSVYTWYVRDAQGNVMAVYEQGATGSLNLTEHHLFGSSRLGLMEKAQNVDGVKAPAVWEPLLGNTYLYTIIRGSKRYELSNHLGNVLVVVSDRKLGVDGDNNGAYDSYEPEVVSAQDYYPFGMDMPDRKYPLDDQYRFGFNGKENDNETNLQDYGFRMYDVRHGRFISMDPITSDYPFYTPYQFAGNKPIIAADLDGLEEWMKSQELAVKQRAQIQMQIAADRFKNVAVVRPYNPGDRSWTQRWRDSKNFLAQITYSGANGLYTLPQQLGASLTGQRHISNIGGNTHEAHGPFGEKQRLENGINGLLMFVPSAAAEQKAASWLGKYADNALVAVENEVTEQVPVKIIQLTKSSFGHTFITHGENMTKFLIERAKGSGMAQGQFLDDQVAAKFILDNLDKTKNGAVSIPIPKDFPARIINPDGSFSQASKIRLVPGGKGVKTAYPEL